MRDGYIRLFHLSKDNFKLSETGKYIYKMIDNTYAELLEDDTVKIFCGGKPYITSERLTLGDTFAIMYYPVNNITTKPKFPISLANKIPGVRGLKIFSSKGNHKSFKLTFL